MSEINHDAIEAAIQSLNSRQPKPRGRREALAPYVPQLRALLAAGWSRVEIIDEIKALGGQMSPALLRDVLQIAPAKPQRASRPQRVNPHKQKIPIASISPTPASPSKVSHSNAAAMSHNEGQQIATEVPPAPTAAPYDHGQQSAQIAPPNGGQPAYDFDPE